MKCIICKSTNRKKKEVREEINRDSDIVLLPVEVLVCLDCGERYYDRKTMRKIEETKQRVVERNLQVKEIGRVLLAEAV
jgi:YgiT-type zinc finger domain-containing protein